MEPHTRPGRRPPIAAAAGHNPIGSARLPTSTAALDHAKRTRDLVAARTHAPVIVRDKGYTLPPNWLPTIRPRES